MDREFERCGVIARVKMATSCGNLMFATPSREEKVLNSKLHDEKKRLHVKWIAFRIVKVYRSIQVCAVDRAFERDTSSFSIE